LTDKKFLGGLLLPNQRLQNNISGVGFGKNYSFVELSLIHCVNYWHTKLAALFAAKETFFVRLVS